MFQYTNIKVEEASAFVSKAKRISTCTFRKFMTFYLFSYSASFVLLP